MRALLLIDHGSRREDANAQLAEIAELVRIELGSTDVLVAHAHMELASPSIEETITKLFELGARELIAVPYFLAPGRHAQEDIPRLVRAAASRHRGLSTSVAAPLGVDRLLAKLVCIRAGLTLDHQPDR